MEAKSDFNTKFKSRTKKFAVEIIRFYSNNCKKSEELRVIGKQLLRSGTSVASNFRAFTRGRSEAEKFSKLCIVVEEVDETQFWFELIEEAELITPQIFKELKEETDELVKVFTTLKSRMKN
ncbi:MAG: four helix bundle protein [Paludibacteraceae bacterium]